MLNLNDKNVRSRLLEQYLLAETSPQEERLLAEYYRNSLDVPDEEEDTLEAGASGRVVQFALW